MDLEKRELGLEELVAVAERLDRAGHHALAEVVDREVRAQLGPLLKTYGPRALHNLAADQVIGTGFNAGANLFSPPDQRGSLLEGTPLDPLGYAKGYASGFVSPFVDADSRDPLSLAAWLGTYGNDIANLMMRRQFNILARRTLIANGYKELLDDANWKAFYKKQGGHEGMLKLLKERFGIKPSRLRNLDNAIIRPRTGVGTDGALGEYLRSAPEGVETAHTTPEMQARIRSMQAAGKSPAEIAEALRQIDPGFKGFTNEAHNFVTPNSPVAYERGTGKPVYKSVAEDIGDYSDRLKPKRGPGTSLMPKDAPSVAGGKVAKNELSILLQHLSAEGQQKVLGLMNSVKSGKLNPQQWMPFIQDAASKVAGKNEASILTALKGIKGSQVKGFLKGTVKKLGPAILVSAFTTLVAEYVEQDPKYAEFAQNPTNNIPGGIAGSIVAYSMPYLGPALMAWDIGWAIGRCIANIPWVHDQLDEISNGLESIYLEDAGVDGGAQADLKNQNSLEEEADGGRLATQMESKFRKLVRDGVAVDQAWMSVFHEMKAAGASPEALIYVRESYNRVKSAFAEEGNYGKNQMPRATPQQEQAALSGIKSDIDRMLAQRKGRAELEQYLAQRLRTVPDLHAQSRLGMEAHKYLYARLQGAPASAPVQASPAPAPQQPATTGTLSRGARGPQVHAWQAFLQTQGVGKIPRNAPAVFGPLTESATREFQQAQKIRVDGIVGPETLGKARQLGGRV